MIYYLRYCAELLDSIFDAAIGNWFFSYLVSLSIIMICWGFFCYISRGTRRS